MLTVTARRPRADGGTRRIGVRQRPGFAALAAVLGLVAIGVIGTLAVLPLVETIAEQGRVEQTTDFLVNLTDTPKQGLQKFLADVGTAPGRMTHLSEEISSGQPDACGGTYNNGNVNGWQPVSNRVFVSSGVPTRLGIIDNVLVHLAEGGQNYVVLEIADVLLEDAQRMDVVADNPTGQTTGRVRWVVSDATQELVTLQWLVPFTSC
jgi:hypothetical protein